MNVLDLAQAKTKLKKVASTHGGEWHGPCPECGGKDRFHVWPEENQGHGGYWCRACGKAGDEIQFLRDFEGRTFQEACAFLNIHMDEKDYKPEPPKQKPEFQPATHQSPAQIWQEKAEALITWAQAHLRANKPVMDWLAARGIGAAAVEQYRLGWNPGENDKDLFRQRKAWGLPDITKDNGKPKALLIPRGLVIPYIVDGIIQRIRIRRPVEHRTEQWPLPYYILPGSSMSTMIIGIERRAYVIVESELDGIACASACDLAGAVAVGTLAGKPDADAFAILKDAIQILNALDYGDQGGGKQAAERAMKWWEEQFPHTCMRWPVPKGKDPGEAYQMGTDLNLWIKAGLPPVLTLDDRVRGSMIKDQEKDKPAPTSQTAPGVIPTDGRNLSEADIAAIIEQRGLGPNILELWKLLRANPAVKIINNDEHFCIQRHGKYVGGRINELVTRNKDVLSLFWSTHRKR